MDILTDISSKNKIQILMATHATEILKRHPVERILNFGTQHPKYLSNDIQRTKLVAGLGDDYAPLIEKARASRALLFVENESDARILTAMAQQLGIEWPTNLAVVASTDKHSDRLKFYRGLLEAIDGLRSVSIRDRDNQNINDIDPEDLRDKSVNTKSFPEFQPLTWRRREIENYALVPDALIAAVGAAKAEEWWIAQGWHWQPNKAVNTHLNDCDIKNSLAKLLGSVSVEDFMKGFKDQQIHADLAIAINAISKLVS